MAIRNNQIEIPFTEADKAKLDTVEEGAQAPAPTASQAEAEAGIDNVKAMTPLRVSQAIAAQVEVATGGSYLSKEFLNDTGEAIDALTPVTQNIAGTMEFINPSVEMDVDNIIGLLLETTLNGGFGVVATDGIIKEVATAFDVGDILYVAKDGTLTKVVPDIDVAGFTADDFVILIGKITQNATNPLAKDLKLSIQVIGSL